VTTFLAVKFLLRYFRTNRLTPFGVYCIGAGVICLLVFALGG
jgi:undecaprenyl pyrophosphate phosphatase UppP